MLENSPANVVFLVNSTFGQYVMTTLKQSNFFNPTRITLFVTFLAAFVALFAANFVFDAHFLTFVVIVTRILFCVTSSGTLMSTIKTNVTKKRAESVFYFITAFHFNLVTAFLKDFQLQFLAF